MTTFSRRARLHCVAASSALAASAAASQAPRGVSCDSIIRSSAVSAERTVQLVLTPGIRGRKMPRPFADELLERLANEFKLPTRISVPRYSSPGRLPTDSLSRGATTWAHPDLYVLVRIHLDAAGIVRRMAPLDLSGDTRVDSTMVGAMHDILSDSVWMSGQRIASQLGGDGAVVDVELGIDGVLTKKEHENREKRIKNGETLVMPLARLQLPHYSNSALAARPQGNSAPLYPLGQSSMNKSGHTILHAVLDTSGVVVPSSVWFDKSTHTDFEEAVRYWLPAVRYGPARIAGCPVPVRITQPFDFKIR